MHHWLGSVRVHRIATCAQAAICPLPVLNNSLSADIPALLAKLAVLLCMQDMAAASITPPPITSLTA
jgi:hypothetical protein